MAMHAIVSQKTLAKRTTKDARQKTAEARASKKKIIPTNALKKPYPSHSRRILLPPKKNAPKNNPETK